MKPEYDLIIIGAGPAGLQASICASTCKLKTLLIEANHIGGQALHAFSVENLIGYPKGFSGKDFIKNAVMQTTKFGTDIRIDRVVNITTDRDQIHTITTQNGKEISAKSILLALGLQSKKIDNSSINKYIGKGVTYGLNDLQARNSYGEIICIIGGANSAGQAAVAAAKYAKKVLLVVRNDLSQSMSGYLLERIKNNKKISVLTNSEVFECSGKGKLETIKIKQGCFLKKEKVNKLAIFIGYAPNTSWLPSNILLQDDGIKDLYKFQTSVIGIFTCGDVRSGSVKSISVAIGEASAAVSSINKYLNNYN